MLSLSADCCFFYFKQNKMVVVEQEVVKVSRSSPGIMPPSLAHVIKLSE